MLSFHSSRDQANCQKIVNLLDDNGTRDLAEFPMNSTVYMYKRNKIDLSHMRVQFCEDLQQSQTDQQTEHLQFRNSELGLSESTEMIGLFGQSETRCFAGLSR